MIRVDRSDHSELAPGFYAQMLAHCSRFRTLEDHADAIMGNFGLPSEQRATVQQGLRVLADRQLLQDEAGALARLSAARARDEQADAPLRTLCIRTCRRPADLERLLSSLNRYVDDASLERVLILDDASDPAAVAQTARVVAAASVTRSLRLVHIDRSARERIISRIAEQADTDVDGLHWLIEGDRDDPSASYGANLNLALLLTAGERFLMIDDDALLDPYALEPPKRSLSLRVMHDVKLRFPDQQHPETEQYERLDLNPIREHAKVLGRDIGDLASAHGLQGGHLLDDLTPQMIHEFGVRPRIRVSTNGTLGDSGIGNMLWLFTQPAAHLADWQNSEERYRAEAFGRRVARSTIEDQIASSASLMTTTLTGVDNRELLLPVPAKGSGEDLLFGVGIRFLHPGTPCYALPWMLPHRLHAPRAWNQTDLEKRVSAGLVDFIATRIEDLADTALPSRPAKRAAVLGDHLRHQADMDDASLREALQRHHLLRRRAGMADSVARTRQTLGRPSPWLAEAMDGIIDRHSQLDASDKDRLDALIPTIRSFSIRYGSALPAWIDAWQWASNVDAIEIAAS
jgi:hypothetical protein